MKFKGKKAIMAAVLSATVAASSFGTIMTAEAAGTYAFQSGGIQTSNGSSGTVEFTKRLNISAGEQVTVTVRPGNNSYIKYFGLLKESGTGEVYYEKTNLYDSQLLFSFNMPAYNLYYEAIFELIPDDPDPTPDSPDPTPTPTPTPDPTPTPTWRRGDVNLDGYVNAKDATAVLKHVVGLEKLTGQSLINADVNGDGFINAKDATEILKIVIGLV